jgi:hypothetical protein
MRRLAGTLVLGLTLLTPAAVFAQSRYYDRDHRDYHEWNEAESRAYRHYLEERRERYREWNRASRAQQRAYWRWRHDHLDWR